MKCRFEINSALFDLFLSFLEVINESIEAVDSRPCTSVLCHVAAEISNFTIHITNGGCRGELSVRDSRLLASNASKLGLEADVSAHLVHDGCSRVFRDADCRWQVMNLELTTVLPDIALQLAVRLN